ncbi:tryptophan synthase subunit alpha [Ornithinimicrobium flavum]|uniref:tryptophan synthase subunit alpha n=1 Tax=Ornithinimicrobium flavum TaxID=1288636 RepID=UPI00106FB8DC|nr:tryptophan synthase subunit alpha [Ornithinimicrobium flavum]
MNALEEVFARARAQERAALICYLPAGYPDLETSRAAVRALAEEGADVVEVGVPYTDPLMDGPVVEQAASAALAAGFRLPQVFDVVQAVQEAGAVPVVMGYWNPVLRYGPDRFAADLAAAGGAGMITPDLVPDEAAAWITAAQDQGLSPIFLVAPSSTTERLAMTTGACRGFVYVASTMGVTGVRESVGDSAQVLVERTRAVTDLPLAVGLGVSTGDQAAQVARFADGVIVGSALVRALTADPSLEGLRALTRELAAGVRRR